MKVKPFFPFVPLPPGYGPPLAAGRNRILVGRREEGKTSLAIFISYQVHEASIVFDPRGMIQGTVVYGAEELEAAIYDGETWNLGPIVYRYDSLDTSEAFAEFCSVLFPPRFPLTGFSCVVDEAGMLQTANSCDANLLRVVKQHPTKCPSIDTLQTSHVLAEFHSQSRSLYDELFVAQLEGPNDLAALVKHTGKPELAEIVRNLKPHQFLRYLYGRQAEGKSCYFIWDDPSAWRILATTPDLDAEKNIDKGEDKAEHNTRGIIIYD